MRCIEVKDRNQLEQCLHIRDVVFIQEQAVLPEEEWDGKEDEARHFLIYVDDEPAATLRVRFYSEPTTPHACGVGALNKTAKIERVATLKKFRGRGTGHALMQFAIQTIADEGIKDFMLEAQVQALPFYEKLGFVAFGDEFLDARIPHRKMRLTL